MSELFFALLAVIVIYVGVRWILSAQGQVEFAWPAKSAWSVSKVSDSFAQFTVKVPLKNETGIDLTIVDAFPRILLPEEQYKSARVFGRAVFGEDAREDGYWEAVIIPRRTGANLTLVLEITSEAGTLEKALAEMPDFNVDLYWQTVCRNPIRIEKQRFQTQAAELKKAFAEKGGADHD